MRLLETLLRFLGLRHFSPRDLDPARADAWGLVAVGGDLRPAWLLQAYRHGVFPWYGPGEPIQWWSPGPRGIIELDDLHISRRLRRTLRSGRFSVTVNRDFAGVIHGCADRGLGTWITAEMLAAYERLHALGHAHSVEVWRGDRLVGGLYGVALGGLFAGESMFSYETDASKVALVFVVERLRERGFELFDIQMVTEHTTRMGATEIPRAEYLRRLQAALSRQVLFC